MTEEEAPVVVDPVTIVIFGGAGDLAHRKLLPALYNLHVDRQLPPPLAIVAVGRKDFTDDSYRQFARDGVTKHSRRPIGFSTISREKRSPVPLAGGATRRARASSFTVVANIVGGMAR